MFEVIKEDRYSKARCGIIKTAHGLIETPSYVIVGTHAEVRCLKPDDIPKTKTRMIIANTYHLWRTLGDKLKKFPGLHKFMNPHTNARELFFQDDLKHNPVPRSRIGVGVKWNVVLMTDSGGFQVFSLGFAREHGVGKIMPFFSEETSPFGARRSPAPAAGVALRSRSAESGIRRIPSSAELREPPQGNASSGRGRGEKNLVRITEDGAYFNDGGEELFLNPEISIGIQEKLGADIILAFDECTSPLHDHAYTKDAMERTHNWARRSLRAKTRSDQWLYGIIQGGEFEDLRKGSAEFIGRLPFDGFAIGGSLGRSRSGMFDVIRWSIPFLPEEKPRHLLGIGRIEDLFEVVEMGVDTFDCVIPTREARHGSLWTKFGRFDIKKRAWQGSFMKIQGDCGCPVCTDMKITRGELYELFKTRDSNAARLATIHNVFFFNDLMEKMRNSIKEENFLEFKGEFMRNLKHRLG